MNSKHNLQIIIIKFSISRHKKLICIYNGQSKIKLNEKNFLSYQT